MELQEQTLEKTVKKIADDLQSESKFPKMKKQTSNSLTIKLDDKYIEILEKYAKKESRTRTGAITYLCKKILDEMKNTLYKENDN